jgi:hypothetical protein
MRFGAFPARPGLRAAMPARRRRGNDRDLGLLQKADLLDSIEQ